MPLRRHSSSRNQYTAALGVLPFLLKIIRFFSFPIIFILLIFNFRRLLFLLAAMIPSKWYRRSKGFSEHQPALPDVLILIPCRDEEKMIADLCQAIHQLEYPIDKYQVVLINDGSCDQTLDNMRNFASGRAGWHVFSLSNNNGKSKALNLALEKFPFGEIAYVLDADHRPKPDALYNLVQHFRDPRVAGVSGLTIPWNSIASPSAYYSAVENFLHQMVTMRAKDRLGLGPNLLGSNCGYRRPYLSQCGGFRNGVLLEDVDVTLRFYLAGYIVRFAEDAVSYHQVPETVGEYLKQHKRWSRGFYDIFFNYGVKFIRANKLSLLLRFELFLTTTGYLDRIALAGAGLLSGLSMINRRLFQFPRQIFFLELLTPFVQIFLLFFEQRMPLPLWLRLPIIPVFFLIDIFSAIRSITDSLLRKRKTWSKTRRVEFIL